MADSEHKGDLHDRVENGFAVTNGIHLHFATIGKGPLVVMLHGFPDYWYTWRDQMDAISSDFKVVAVDLRGYNRSDKPQGVENYAMPILVGDVEAVIRHHGAEKAVVVGHDWGGAVAWSFALTRPEMTEKLVVLNLPHPNGLVRELRDNPEQYEGSSYARVFQEKDPSAPDVFFGRPMTPETLSFWVKDAEVKKRYIEAFNRSDFTAMLNYYKANYPRIEPGAALRPSTLLPKVKMPVLMFHGLEDQALHSNGLNNTWDWLESD